jgi:O-antigen ligase
MRWSCYISIDFLFCAYWSLVPVLIIDNFPHGGEKWKLAMTVNSAPAQILFLVLGIDSVVSDLFILILPLPCLLKLHVSWQRKTRIYLVFATAIMYVFLMALDQSTC